MDGTSSRKAAGEPPYTTTQAAASLGVTPGAIRQRLRIASIQGRAIGERDHSHGPWRLTKADLARLAAWPTRQRMARSQPPARTFTIARTIRRRIRAGEDRGGLAAAYGLSLEELSALVDRRNWREAAAAS
jgi:hypothetical protein